MSGKLNRYLTNYSLEANLKCAIELRVTFSKAGDKPFLRIYKAGKEIRNDVEISKRVSRMLYMGQAWNWQHIRHLNHLKPIYTMKVKA